MMAGRPGAPPRLARAILAAVLPPTVAGRSTLGDLSEEYHRRPRGLRRRWWFWIVSLEIVARYLPGRAAGVCLGLLRDARYAMRLARKYPGLVTSAILSLSLAIGICTAAFSVANSTWLRPNLEADASLVRIWRRHANGASASWPVSEFQQIRERARTVSIEGTLQRSEPVGPAASPHEDVTVGYVTGQFFALLNERAHAGRLLQPSDDRPGAPPAVVLDHLYWRRRLGADRGVLGQRVTIRGVDFTVVGIGRRDFIDPSRRQPAMWASMASLRNLPGTTEQMLKPSIVGRLGHGTTTRAVTVELTGLLGSVVPAPGVPAPTAFEAFATIDADEIAANRRILSGVFTVIGLVLVLAIANVSNLQLAGAASRRQEIAVRLSCGASRGRILRQFVAESALVSAVSAALGLLVATWLAPLLVAGLNMTGADVGADLRVYGFAAVAAALCVVLTALAPAQYGSRRDIATCLTAAPSHDSRIARPGRARSIFIGIQTAAAIVFVSLAALQVRALAHLAWMDPGVDVAQVLAVSSDLPRMRPDEKRIKTFWADAIERVRQMPGVERAALATFTPFNIRLGNPFELCENTTDADYFATAGLRVVRGRSYTATEVAGREKVAVISERLAHRFWRDEDPLGASASRIDSLYAGVRIIGIVEDAFVDSVDERRPPTIYLPFLPEAFAQIAIRTANPEALAGAVKQALDELSPGITVKTAVIADEYRRQFERPRRHAALGACAAVFALVLSVAGLVGVTSFAMRTRVREIGIRLALGARPAEIRRLLVRDALRPVMAGLIVGVGASLLAGRTVASLFYGLSERDPAALVSATAVLLLTTLAAVMVPVRRAARLDPAVVLRDS